MDEPITILFSIGFLILAIVMLVKFFQMAADISDLKELLTEHFKKESAPDVAQKTKSDETLPPSSEMTTPSYRIEGDCVIFADGVQGDILEKFGAFSFEDSSGKRFYFETREGAIKGLYYSLNQPKQKTTKAPENRPFIPIR